LHIEQRQLSDGEVKGRPDRKEGRKGKSEGGKWGKGRKGWGEKERKGKEERSPSCLIPASRNPRSASGKTTSSNYCDSHQ